MSDNHEPPTDLGVWNASADHITEADRSASETHDPGRAPGHGDAAQDNDDQAGEERHFPTNVFDELLPENEEFWDDNCKSYHYTEQYGGYTKISDSGEFPKLIFRRPKGFYTGPRQYLFPENYSQVDLRHGQSGAQMFPVFVSANRSQAFRDQCISAGFVSFDAKVDGFESLNWGMETVDASEKDTEEESAGEENTGEENAGEENAGEENTGEGDAGEGDAGEGDAGEGDAGEGDAGEGAAGAEHGEAEDEAGQGDDAQEETDEEEDNLDLMRLTIPDDSAKGLTGTACLLEDTSALPTMIDLAWASHKGVCVHAEVEIEYEPGYWVVCSGLVVVVHPDHFERVAVKQGKGEMKDRAEEVDGKGGMDNKDGKDADEGTPDQIIVEEEDRDGKDNGEHMDGKDDNDAGGEVHDNVVVDQNVSA